MHRREISHPRCQRPNHSYKQRCHQLRICCVGRSVHAERCRRAFARDAVPEPVKADARRSVSCGLMVGSRSLAARLDHVFWIGGGSGAGKSTIARRLATEGDLVIYDTDEAMADHVRRCGPTDCPLLHEFIEMDMDERWVARSPEVMLETFHWFCGEGFDFVVEDLLDLPTGKGVIVEGFRLLPRLVAPLLDDSSHAVWLLPSPAFRHAAITSRGTINEIAGRTSDPARGLDNLLRRDDMFTDRLRSEIGALNLTSIDVDLALSEDELVSKVAELFGSIA